MSEQRVPFTVRAEARDGLADWWADRIDSAFFNQLGGNTGETDTRRTGSQATLAPDGDHVIYYDAAGTSHTAETSVSTTDTFNLEAIDWCVEKAETLKNPIRPIRMGKDKYWVMFLHPFQVTDLRTNTSTGQWLDIQKAAMQGGQITKNPIFTGALGVYNNTILHSNTRVPSVQASTRRAVFAGAQAGAVAFGRRSGKNTYSWREELFDYGNQLGVAAGSIWGLKKCRFNGSDHASIVVTTYAVAKA